MGIGQTPLGDLGNDADDDIRPPGAARRSTAKRTPTADARRKGEKELAERLEGCFDRIAESLDARGDERLASIIRDDAAMMAGGLVSMTRPLAALRTPLTAALAIAEPALAFGRVLRELLGRWGERRANRQAEHEAARAETEMQPPQP